MFKRSIVKFSLLSLVLSFFVINPTISNAQNSFYIYTNSLLSANTIDLAEYDRQITLTIKNKDYNSALNLLQQVYQVQPGNSNIPYLMAICYFNFQDAEKTIFYAKKALALKPDDPEFNGLLGMQLFLTGDYQAALPCLQKTISRKSNDLTYQLYIAKTYEGLKNYPKALEHYQKIYKLNPADENILGNLSVTYFLMNDTTKAIDYAEKCLSKQPLNPTCNYLIGSYNINIDQDKAILYLDKAVDIDKSYVQNANKLIKLAEELKITKLKKELSGDLNVLAEKSSSVKVMQNSPDSDALQNGSTLYTGAINTYTESGKALSEEQKVIANEIISGIDTLSVKFSKAKELNQQFTDNEAKQLEIFQSLAEANKIKKEIIKHESTIFEQTLEYQIQENYYWSITDSIQQQLDKYKAENPGALTDSIVVTDFYIRLIHAYTELFEFYKVKYQDFIAFAVFNHALEENPKVALSKDVIAKIKPYHNKELELSKQLIYDFESNFNQIKKLSASADKLGALYNKMDTVSLSEVEKTIAKLEAIKANSNNAKTEIIVSSELNGYIELYKSIKSQLEAKITTFKIKKAALDYLKKTNKEYLVYKGKKAATNNTTPKTAKGGFASSIVSSLYSGAAFVANTGIKTTKLLAGTLLAEADYATGFVAEKCYNVSSKIQMKINYGQDYQKYASQFDKMGEKIYVVSLNDTLINPVMATLQGNDAEGVGQTAVAKFKESNKEFKEKVIGNSYTSNILANLATLGSYGLTEDFITLNDAKASSIDKVTAGIGTFLAFIPALNASKSLSETGKTAISTLKSSVKESGKEIAKIAAKKEAAKTTTTAINLKIFETMEEMLTKPELTTQLTKKLNTLISKKEMVKESLQEAEKELVKAELKSIVKVPSATLTSSVKTALETFVGDHTPAALISRVNELFKAPLSQVVKNSDSFFGKTITSSIGVKDTANFLTSTALNNILGDGLKSLIVSLNEKSREKKTLSTSKNTAITPKTKPVQQPKENNLKQGKEKISETQPQNTVFSAGKVEIIPSKILNLAKQNAKNKNATFGVGLGEYVSGIPESLLDQAYNMSVNGNPNIPFSKLFNQNLVVLMQKNGIQTGNVAIIVPESQQQKENTPPGKEDKSNKDIDIGSILSKIMPEVQKKINEDLSKMKVPVFNK